MKKIFKKKNYLALILARKGSKRLKNKNILKLSYKPLVLRTIKNLKKIKNLFIDILVSSDSKQIEIFSKKENILFFKRPKNLSSSKVTSEKSAIHAVKNYINKFGSVDYVILFQPTSPFRRNSTIRKTIKLSKKFPRKQIVGVDPKSKKPNGVIYLTPFNVLKKKNSFKVKNFVPLVIKSKKESIDIDTKEDFVKAKKYLKLSY